MAKRSLVLVAVILLMALVACAGVQEGQAPDFTLTNIKGKQISLSDYKGYKAVLLLFSSYQTGGVQDPLQQEYVARYQPTEKLETLLIGNWSVAPEEVQQFRASKVGSSGTGTGTGPGSAITLLSDKDGSVSRAYRASPDKLILVLVDREGRIRLRQEAPPPVEDNRELSNQIAEITK